MRVIADYFKRFWIMNIALLTLIGILAWIMLGPYERLWAAQGFIRENSIFTLAMMLAVVIAAQLIDAFFESRRGVETWRWKMIAEGEIWRVQHGRTGEHRHLRRSDYEYTRKNTRSILQKLYSWAQGWKRLCPNRKMAESFRSST